MGLGPRLDVRVSQQLVMSQQLQAAIKLLALSNLELESVIAEALADNPLLQAAGSAAEGDVVRREDREFGDDAADPASADALIDRLGGTDDSPLDMDWREAALEWDSASEAAGNASDEGFDFDRLAACESGLCEHLMEQLHGTGGALGRLAEAIVNDQRRILPCAAWLDGEYGMKGLFLGVPCKLGKNGLEKVIEVELTADERAALEKSAEAVREPMSAIKM